jgi:hypothetical protein
VIKNPALGYSATLEVTIGGVPVDYSSMTSITIEYDENKHDLATIRMSGLPAQAVVDYRGAPVEIVFYTSPSYRDTFIGYVEEVNPVSETRQGLINGSPIQDATLTCLGASYGMRGDRSKIWEDISLLDITDHMAYTYGFSYSVPDTGIRYHSKLQHDESDFSFLSRQAREHGLSMSVHGTHIDVWDPFDALSRRKALFYASGIKNAFTNTQPSPGQITKFKASFGRNAADGVYKDTSVSVLGDRGVTFDVTSSKVLGVAPGQFPHRQSVVVDSYAEAENIIKAESRKHYDYTAKLEVLGIAGALPGTVLLVDGFNTEYDGYWYVRGVKHTITTGVFSSVLDVARNATLQFENTNVSKYRTPPAASYVNGKWRASRLRSDVYST